MIQIIATMNQPSLQTHVQLLQSQVECLQQQLREASAELDKASDFIGHALTGLSFKEPYQLLRQYYEGRLDEEKVKRRMEVERLKASMKAREDCFKGTIAQLEQSVIDLRSQLAMYKDQVNGSGKSERFAGDELTPSERSSAKEGTDADGKRERKKRKKGPRKRSKFSGGRSKPQEVADEIVIHELPVADRKCPFCGRPYAPTPYTREGSTVVEMRICITVVEHRQACYESTCNCHIPKITVTPRTPRAMTRSLYSDDLWLNLLCMKYAQQIPTNRCVEWLAMHGLENVSLSTLCAGFARMSKMFSAVDQMIIEHNQQASWWAADESGLKVFVERAEREGRHWAVWQIRSVDTSVFMLSSTKEANEILTYFVDAPNGEVLLSDRAQTFKTLDLWFAIAFCWAHMRRDFVRLGRYYKGNRCWAIDWLGRIRRVYRIFNRRKKEPPDSDRYRDETGNLLKENADIRAILERELAAQDLSPRRKKILNSLDRHWDGLWRFIEDVRLPIDNNETEQGFRPLARARNSSYGCHSEDHAHHLVRFLTLFETLSINKIPPRAYLRAYMAEVAVNDGTVPRIEEWAPWKLSTRVQALITAKSQTQ
jgi:transposase